MMCWCCGRNDIEPTNRNVAKPRGCTDVLCLIIFIIFWIVLIFITAFAFVIGNPLRLVNGFDSFGNICGVDNTGDDSKPVKNQIDLSGRDMSEKPYVFFFDLHNLKDCWKTCVKKCPDKEITNMKELLEFEKRTGSELCRYDHYLKKFNNDREKLYTANKFSACPNFTIYHSHPVLNRCIPVKIKGLIKNLLRNIYAYLNNVDLLQQVVGDLYASWRVIIGMTFVSLFVSFIMVLLIRYVASFVSWIIMLVVLIATIALTVTLWWTYIDLKFDLDSTPFEELLSENAQNEKAFLAFSIISTIITIILLLVVIVMRKRVELVVALFHEASKCIRAMPCLLLQPLWTFIALLVFFIYWIIVLMALATAEYAKHRSVILSPNSSSTISNSISYESKNYSLLDFSNSDPSWVKYMWWFHLIALIWVSEFILACQQMVIAGAVSYWYFSRNRKELKCPIAMSAYKLTIYHLGSVALGSFLITLVKIPRLILTYLQATMKKYEENQCVKCCLKCCTCCLWCLEKCIRYLNHNAYTVVAIDGMSFCPAARVAFNALVSNALRVAAINSVGDFILFLGKCAIAAITGFISLLILKNDENLHFYAIPAFVIFIFAFFTGHCVLSVYEMVIDTLFLCFCEDYDKNDGSPGKEYYAPASLLEFLTDKKVENQSEVEQSSKQAQYIVDSSSNPDAQEMKRFSGSTEKAFV